jgi:3-oxoacyl-[acyl-carrier-protein] synthase-3
MINIKHIISTVPKTIKKINGFKNKKVIKYSGFKKIHILKKKTTSELVFFCVNKFFQKSKIKPNKIDALIYSSHSRDLEMPIFSASIQNKFSLKNNLLCYDLPNSCSGFTNSLIHAYALIASGLAKNILIVCADTHSKISTNKNLKNIIGDACSCVFIEKKVSNSFYHDIGVDGKNNNILKIEIKNGIKKLNMDGLKVLEFAIKRVPETISNILKKSKLNLKKIDYYSFHQPNKSIVDHLIKKLQLNRDKMISTFDFGNTSSPSIPLALSKNFKDKFISNKKFIFCGFGAGLQWSTVITTLKKTFVHKIYYL